RLSTVAPGRGEARQEHRRANAAPSGCAGAREREARVDDQGHGGDLLHARQDDGQDPALPQAVERDQLSRPRSSRWRPTPWLGGSLLVVLVTGALPLAWLVIVALGDIAISGTGVVSSRTAALVGNTRRLGIIVAWPV